MRLAILCLGVWASWVNAATDAGLTLIVRPHAGFGISLSGDSQGSGLSYQYGGRAMFGIGSESRAGVEYIRLGIANVSSFKAINALGGFLEQRIAKKYTIGIGLSQFDPIGTDTQKNLGVVATIGWEPKSNGRFEPFFGGRVDTILRSAGNIFGFSFFGGFSLYIL